MYMATSDWAQAMPEWVGEQQQQQQQLCIKPEMMKVKNFHLSSSVFEDGENWRERKRGERTAALLDITSGSQFSV